MPEGADNNSNLLNPGEPTPYRIINPLAESPTLLVCDHASSRFPEALAWSQTSSVGDSASGLMIR